MKLSKLRKKTDRLLEELRHLTKRVDEEKEQLTKQLRRVKDTTKAQEIIISVAQKIQQEAHTRIAGVVTRCLAAVFDDPYKFEIEFERKRGKTNAKLMFIRKKYKVDPINGAGGGVVDVASFALQLACLKVQKPKRRDLLIMDEPFKFVSDRKEYRERVRALIEALSEEMNVQFVFVTHDRALEMGKVIDLGEFSSSVKPS